MSIPPIDTTPGLTPENPLPISEAVSAEEAGKFSSLANGTEPQEGITTEELNRRLAESNKRFTFQQMVESVRRNETEVRRQILEWEKEEKERSRVE